MVHSLLFVGGGLILLTVGADGFVRGAASLARRIGISPLVVGLTVVALATSLPELLVSVSAALRGNGGVSLGNVVGSNISNIGLILGISALVGAIGVKAQIIRIDGPILVGCSVLLLVLGVDGTLSRTDGIILAGLLVGYVVFSIHTARREPRTGSVQTEFDEALPLQHAGWLDGIYLVGGLAAILGGAHVLVDGAVTIARSAGISDAVVGLTIVAIGTSLPELATSVTAAWNGEGDLAIGNAVGSSIFNVLGILGATVIIQPLDMDVLRPSDALVMTGFAVALLPLLRTGFTLSRREGAVLILGYLAYVFSLVAPSLDLL